MPHTSCPSANSRSARCDPIKPATPVTRQRMSYSSSTWHQHITPLINNRTTNVSETQTADKFDDSSLKTQASYSVPGQNFAHYFPKSVLAQDSAIIPTHPVPIPQGLEKPTEPV